MVKGLYNIKNVSILLVVFLLVVVLSGCSLFDKKEVNSNVNQSQKAYSENESKEVAFNWILKNSPTYLFDGFDLKYLETLELRCVDCYLFTFTFKSSQGGFGDRKGQVLAQVVTPHTIAVAVDRGKIGSAVTDGRYDEVKKDFLK